MVDDVKKKAAIAAILEQWKAIREQKTAVQRRRMELTAEDRELDRKMADCRAAARLFGMAEPLPGDDGSDQLNAFKNWVTFVDPDLPRREKDVTMAKLLDEASKHTAKLNEETKRAIEQLSVAPARPPIRDLVLDFLKHEGNAGAKAKPIQSYIERTYGRKLHYKTVGMTLYRLQKEGAVRREGHTWFFNPHGAEKENPGVAAPGRITAKT